MKYLKVENSTLISAPTFDERTGTVNCHLNKDWLSKNGFIKYEDDEAKELEKLYNQDFFDACDDFKDICSSIQTYFGVSSFIGSNKDIISLYSLSGFSTAEGRALITQLENKKDECAIEANKIGVSKFSWYNKCCDFPNSDLVKLGILPKPISEYTVDDIGTSIFIPYNDPTNSIKGPIEFEIVGVNHHTNQCTNSFIKNTITLMSKHILKRVIYDVAEPDNPNSDRATKGNNRYAVSNIRQWLNSTAPSGDWYDENWAKKLGHEYDVPPTVEYANSDYTDYVYFNSPGFLNGFDKNILEHFAKINNSSRLSTIDGGGNEITQDYVFLPSADELNIYNSGYGNPLSYRFTDDESRIKTNLISPNISSWNYYFTRFYTDRSVPYGTIAVMSNGHQSGTSVYHASGVAPMIVLY